jgi:hypothetical protein
MLTVQDLIDELEAMPRHLPVYLLSEINTYRPAAIAKAATSIAPGFALNDSWCEAYGGHGSRRPMTAADENEADAVLIGSIGVMDMVMEFAEEGEE